MRGWREELLKCNEKEVYLKIDNENTEDMEGIAKVIKDKSNKIQNKILVVGDRRIFESIIIRSELCRQRIFVDDEHKIIGDGNTGKSIYFRRRIDQSLRGRRFDITIISIPSSLDNEIIRQARLISNQVIVLVDRDQTIINKKLIEVDEHKYSKSNGELLKDEIKRLYEELAEIPHNERTTMTREKIVDMIFKLERLDLDKYSYINNYEDKVIAGVSDKNNRSETTISKDMIACKFDSKISEAKYIPDISKIVSLLFQRDNSNQLEVSLYGEKTYQLEVGSKYYEYVRTFQANDRVIISNELYSICSISINLDGSSRMILKRI